MKIVLLVLFIPLFAIAFGLTSSVTKYDSEIEKDIRKLISEKRLQFINAVLNEDVKTIESIASKWFKKNTNTKEFIKKLKPTYLKSPNQKLINEYYTTVESMGKIKTFTFLPSNDRHLIVNNITKSEKMYIQFVKRIEKGIQDLHFYQFILENNKWKLNFITMGVYSYNDLIAPDYINLTKKHYDKKEYLNSAIYAISAYKLLRPRSFLQYKKEDEYKKIINKSFTKAKEVAPFPIKMNKSKSSIFQINMDSFSNGLFPIVKYITKMNLDEPNSVKEEVTSLKNEFDKLYPEVGKEFKYVIFQAYNEEPVSSKKNYKMYNSIIEMRK